MATTTTLAPTGKRYPRILAGIAVVATLLATIAVLMRLGPFAAIIVPAQPNPLTASDLLPAPAAQAPLAVAGVVGPPPQSSSAPAPGGTAGGSHSYPGSGSQPAGGSNPNASGPTSGPAAPPSGPAAPTAPPVSSSQPTSAPTSAPTAGPTPGPASMPPTVFSNTYSGIILAGTSTCPSGTAAAYQCTYRVTNNDDGTLAVEVRVGAGVSICAEIWQDDHSRQFAQGCGVGSVIVSSRLSGGDYIVVMKTATVTTTGSATIGHS